MLIIQLSWVEITNPSGNVKYMCRINIGVIDDILSVTENQYNRNYLMDT